MFADTLNQSLAPHVSLPPSTHSILGAAKTNVSEYNRRFLCVTEEVMLAEENKNSGRSALDGELTLSTHSQPTVHVSVCFGICFLTVRFS